MSDDAPDGPGQTEPAAPDQPSAYQRGAAMMDEVYAGDVVSLPEGTMPFMDAMLTTLFSEVWTREALSIRDRRLLLMGVIAARASTDTWKVQARAALKRGELTADQLRETLVILAPYAGYPAVAPLVAETEAVIAALADERDDAPQ
ncbi:MAG: carboxymuconolactone decarboxylase family protein [Microthrixaceae bacterium]